MITQRGLTYGRALAATALLYAAIYGGLLISCHGLPYVLDNNESFSSIIHARNLYTFDFWKSFGLTDESFSPHPEAHPYPHTHQGNLPRLFAFVIYALGARTIESQVVITTFTVGLLAMYLIFDFFARRVSPLFALITCAVLMSDYVMFAQWQMNTYRVWHGLLLFSSLRCVEGIGGPRARVWRILSFVNCLFLFYYEFVFVVFVTLTCLCYAAYLYRRSLTVALHGCLYAGAGALLAVTILLVQLSAYMGVQNAFRDACLTIKLRQFTDVGDGGDDTLAFYRENKVACFANLQDGTKRLQFETFLRDNLTGNLTAYTPLLCLVLLGVTLGWFHGAMGRGIWPFLAERRWLHRLRRRGASFVLRMKALIARTAWGRWLAQDDRAGSAAVFLCLGLCSVRFLRVLVVHGVPHSHGPAWMGFVVPGLGGAAIALLICRIATDSWRAFGRLPLGRVVTAGAALLLFAWLLRHQQKFFSEDAYPHIAIAMTRHRWMVGYLAAIAGAILMALLIVAPTRVLGRRAQASLDPLLPFLLSGCLAYAVLYPVAGGYIYSGYLSRWLSFLVFFTVPLLSVGIYLILFLFWRGVRLWWLARTPAGSELISRGSGAALIVSSAALLLWVVGYWARLQMLYVASLPPTHFDFLNRLREPPFAGASFVVGGYAAPITYATNGWAICDATLADGDIWLDEDGFVVPRNHTMLWLADRTNPAYERPDYYLYLGPPTMYLANLRVADSVHHQTWFESAFGLERDMARTIDRMVGPHAAGAQLLNWRVADCDPTGAGRWAVIKLNWDFPPYLKPMGSDGEQVRVHLQEDDDGLLATVHYRFAHQDGRPEGESQVTLHDASGRIVSCEQVCAEPECAVFRLPRSLTEKVRAVVRPRTETRWGTPVCSAWVDCDLAQDMRRSGADGPGALRQESRGDGE